MTRHRASMAQGNRDMDTYLQEGVLTEQFIIDKKDDILNCMRRCNVALRWLLLHRCVPSSVVGFVALLDASAHSHSFPL